jgi:hypothetical protein
MSELERFARRLRDERGFSRNRRFDELSSPPARRLRARLRRLSGLAAELARAHSTTVEPWGVGYRLTLDFPAVRARREAFLTAEEHALLTAEGHLSPPAT